MLVRFANNQTMVSIAQDMTTIYTDPQSVGGMNRAEVAALVHRLFSAGSNPTITWFMEGSNDGTNWFAVDNDPITSESTTPDTKEVSFSCAFIRFKFTLVAGTATAAQITSACFDIHANLIHT